MVLVYSATKGLAAMTLAIAHSRGWLDYDKRVCSYWPEFAQQGKERITVRQLLAHQAGLFAFDEQADRSLVADLDRLAVVLARQKPVWEPGTRQAYHAISPLASTSTSVCPSRSPIPDWPQWPDPAGSRCSSGFRSG
jgi:CubicO group peptidase (beta-lactamase class C family)